MADNVGESVPENAQDLTIFVQNLLEQMVRLFRGMYWRHSIELNSCDILGEWEDLSTMSKQFWF